MDTVNITKENVKERSALLVDQYRQKAQLHAHNVLLVPLGEDFGWSTDGEWTAQYDNYKILFEFMNSQPEWNINVSIIHSIFIYLLIFKSIFKLEGH